MRLGSSLWRPHFTRKKPFHVGIYFFQVLPSYIINKNKNPKSNKILNKYKLKIKSKKLNKLKYLSPLCHKFASSFSHFLHPLDLAMWRISLQSEKLEVSISFFSFLFLREIEQMKNQTEIKMKLFLFFNNKYTRFFLCVWELYKTESCTKNLTFFNIFFKK